MSAPGGGESGNHSTGGGGSDGPWVNHRRRAEVLRERFPFAAEMLTLYLALLDVWDEGWDLVRDDRPEAESLPQWTVERVLPGVVKATEAAGPEPLATAARGLIEAGGLVGPLAAWLRGEELPPVERYLARAALFAPLAAGDADAACADDPSPRGVHRCPHCDGLVSGRRHLVCARCGRSWSYSASSCPSCGETTGSKRTVYAERQDGPVVGRGPGGGVGVRRGGDESALDVAAEPASTFPHLRVEACAACQRYVIDVDLSRDPQAVAEVDELAALPLDLYATEHGLTKITPNIMGF
jgi:Protein involved in formate dehydrogenase formation